MYFVEALRRSIYDLRWLKKSALEPGKAWRYFLLFTFIVSLVTSAPLIVSAPSLLADFSQKLSANVPNFTAMIKSGKLAVSGFDQPKVFRAANGVAIIVATTGSTTPVVGQFVSGTDSALLLTQTGMTLRDGQTRQEQTQSWSNLPDHTITKSDLVSEVGSLRQPVTFVLAMILMAAVIYLAALAGRLVTLLIIAVLVRLVANIARKNWPFGPLFTLGLFAATLPTLVALVLSLAGVTSDFAYPLALLAFLLAVVFTKDSADGKKEVTS